MATGELTRQQLLIGGDWRGAGSGGEYEQVFPYNGDLIGRRRRRTRGRPRRGRRCLGRVCRMVTQRTGDAADDPSKAADLLMERQQEIAGCDRGDRRVFGWGMFNVELAAGMLREAAAPGVRAGRRGDPIRRPGKLAMGVRQPAGVVVAIAPWNAPVILGTRAVATPLAYANTVVLKASEKCPAHACRDRPGAGRRRAAARRDQPDHERAGRCGRRRRRADRPSGDSGGSTSPARARSGGSSPRRRGAISSACCSSSAARRRWSCWPTPTWTVRRPRQASGRSSSRPDLHVDRADRGRPGGVRVRWPSSPNGRPRFRSAIPASDDGDRSARQRGGARAGERAGQDAVSKGADALSGGEPDGPASRPRCSAGVTPEMRLYSEESFGPVVAVVDGGRPDEAVRVANDSEYGLSAAVFSENVPAALELAQRIESGICHVNDTTVQDEPQMPSAA